MSKKPQNSFFTPDGKLNKVTEDGVRIVNYPTNGGVLYQPPGMSHKEYCKDVGNINKIDPRNNDLLDHFK